MKMSITARGRPTRLKPVQGLAGALLSLLMLVALSAAIPAAPAFAQSFPANHQPENAVFVIEWQTSCATPPSGAVAALAAAASEWGDRLSSPLPIHVSACWTAAPPCSGLACGRAAANLFNALSAPQVDTAYPVALANALAGQDLNGSLHEIAIWFDSDESWSFEISPAGNFMVVAMHELGHGLGFESGLYESYNIGFCGDGPSGYLYPCPTAYDRLVVDALGVPLLDYKMPDPRVLGAKLKSDANFGGANTRLANAGAAVPLYTPPVFDQGSSIVHLAMSYIGSPEGLMTPTAGVAPGSLVGPLTLQMFRDLGWPLAGSWPNLSSSGPLALGVDQSSGFTAALDWPAYAGQAITYDWKVDDQPAIQHSGAGLTDTLSLDWGTAGLHRVVITASGPFGQAATTRLLLVFDLDLTGPASCSPGSSCFYTASLLPGNTSLPVDYLWQASEQSDISHPNQGASDTVAFTWSSAGQKTITLTVTIAGQSIQAVYTVTVGGGGLPVKLFLPAMQR